MPKPTNEQLEKINKFALAPLTEDNCYVFNDMMIDDGITSYHSIIHENLLRKFLKDTRKGVGLLMSHNRSRLPVGRSFDASLVEDVDEEGNIVKSLYGHFYIALGRGTESGMTTDDIVHGIESGTISDTSIGFNAKSFKCSICENDIRDYFKCGHFPGKKYVVEGENGDDVVTCYVIVGEDGQGELLENSLVYSGACDRASIVNTFSRHSVKDTDNGTKLHLVDSIKSVPLDSTIYMYYSKDGYVFFTETPERTDAIDFLSKRSEEEVEFKQFLDSVNEIMGFNSDSPDAIIESLKQYRAETSTLSSELENVRTELSNAEKRVNELEAEKETLKQSLSTKDVTIEELTRINEELSEKAELANTYKNDLIDKALELGVRAQGNAFNKPMFERFLKTLSVDEVKEVITGFENEVVSKFDGVRTSTTRVPKTRTSFDKDKITRDSFETEEEFRDFVADEALAYAKENNVSLKEATKLMFEKYAKDGE